MDNWRRSLLSFFLWIAAAAWCGALFYFSGQNGADSSNLSMRVTEFVLRVIPSLPFTANELNPILRDLAHFGIFAVEGFLLGAAMMTSFRPWAIGGLLAKISCAVVAVCNEIHQSFVDGRSCEVQDMLVDAGGGATGVLFAVLLLALAFGLANRRRERRKNVRFS